MINLNVLFMKSSIYDDLLFAFCRVHSVLDDASLTNEARSILENVKNDLMRVLMYKYTGNYNG